MPCTKQKKPKIQSSKFHTYTKIFSAAKQGEKKYQPCTSLSPQTTKKLKIQNLSLFISHILPPAKQTRETRIVEDQKRGKEKNQTSPFLLVPKQKPHIQTLNFSPFSSHFLTNQTDLKKPQYCKPAQKDKKIKNKKRKEKHTPEA